MGITTGQYVPAHAIARPALLRELDEALTRRVTLVVAQAGAGKSVLLTQWLGTLDIDAVWLDVTDADNDPEFFVRHLRQAFARPLPGVHNAAPTTSLAGPVLGARLVEDIGAIFSAAGPCVLVIDDLHNLHGISLLEDLHTVLSQLPPTVHVVLSSRTDPPIAWGSERMHGEVGELRQAQLAFSDQESARLLCAVSGVRLDDNSMSALVARTEGWAAGIQLAALTLKRHPDPAAFVAHFSGSDRMVADYLSGEVVQALSDDFRALVFSMAALDRMSNDLVAFATDAPGAHAALQKLEHASMFLIPLDDGREWFRFHQLFRDLLRFQSHQYDPDAERHVLIKAAEWHDRRGEWQPAVEYLLRAREWDSAADIILTRGSEVFERGQIAQVIAVIERIPAVSRAANIDLSLLHAILIGIVGRSEPSEDILQRIVVNSRATAGQRVCAETFLAALAQWRPQSEASIGWAMIALASLDVHGEQDLPELLRLTDAQSLRTIATVSGGRAHFLAGELDESRRWLNRALLTRGAAYSLWRISALGALAVLEAWTGDMAQAEALAADAVAVADAVDASWHPSTAEAHLALGLVALASGDKAQAAQSVQDGWSRAEANGRVQLEWVFYAACHADALFASRAKPAGNPPPVAAQRMALTARHGIHPSGWVAAHSEINLTRYAGADDDVPARISDPLTDRELEILAYMPTRLTSDELAARLFVSVNTIKTHVAHIYQKLEVGNRRDAVIRATELGILRL